MSGQVPAKPPRSTVEEEGGRTLWQICWNEAQAHPQSATQAFGLLVEGLRGGPRMCLRDLSKEEPVVSMVDISEIDLSSNSDFRQYASLDEESGDIVVFEKNASEMEGKIKKGGSIYKKPYSHRNTKEGVDMSAASMVGWKFLVRSDSDSDLDLISPGGGRAELCARARWCCMSCRTVEFWRHYWWIPALIVLAVVIYVLITLFIVKAMLDAPL